VRPIVADDRALVPLEPHEVGPGWFLLRLALGTALFSIHVTTSFTVTVVHCDQSVMEGSLAGVAVARLVLLAITFATLAGALWITLSSLVTLRSLPREEDGGNGRSPFLASVSAVIGGVLVVYLAWALIVASTLPLC